MNIKPVYVIRYKANFANGKARTFVLITYGGKSEAARRFYEILRQSGIEQKHAPIMSITYFSASDYTW